MVAEMKNVSDWKYANAGYKNVTREQRWVMNLMRQYDHCGIWHQKRIQDLQKDITILKSRPGSNWIPVSERLPEQDQLVLAWSKVFARQSDSGAMCARYDRDTFGDEIMDFHEITHWQPIEPPE